MNKEYLKVYRESIGKYASVDERVDMFQKTLDKKAKEAKKMEKSDPESANHLDSLITGMQLAYQILRGSPKEGWINID